MAEQPETVWDIGCNTGQFSRVAASLCKQVIATDIDHVAVERLYLDEKTPYNILPLVQNIADPSPNWGWRNEFIDWLAGLTGKLLIEYVSRKDDKLQTLLRNKDDKYQDYSRESLEASLTRHFDIERQLDVNNGDRTLYFCAKP